MKKEIGIHEEVKAVAERAKAASRSLSGLSPDLKNQILNRMADRLENNEAALLEENQKDLKTGEEKGRSQPMMDRLRLTSKVVRSMADGLREVARLPDPIGEVVKRWHRPNGLWVERVRIPIGVIGIIYESRPNVTADAAGLCLKSGNGVILRGGSEAFFSNRAIGDLLREVILSSGVPGDVVQIFPFREREAMQEMLQMEDQIDLIIPRGGEDLIRFVTNHSRIPVLKHYKGVCHIFIDETADPEMAVRICLNAKVQKPAVCNAMETLLVHENAAPSLLPPIAKALREKGVELRGCPKTCRILPGIREATEDDWGKEYLDLILSVKVVNGMKEAMGHIAAYGSSHTEAILTSNHENAERFLNEVDSSCVLVNASTRFNDGFELGLGAEIGISTTKLHAFGPMGLEELTTTKFVVHGDGQIRD